jgi:hypothetical protein
MLDEKNIANSSKKLLTKNNKKSQSVWVFSGLESVKWAILGLHGFIVHMLYPPPGSYIGAPTAHCAHQVYLPEDK